MMKFIRALLVVGISSFGFVSCGSSGDENETVREFSQGVDLINYSLKKLDIDLSLGPAGTKNVERLRKSIGEAGASKDEIQRVIKGSSFVLLINKKESPLQISSAGEIDRHQTVSEKTPSCQLKGTSKVRGEASSLKLDLVWDLNVDLEGESCDAALTAKFFQFQDIEIDAFHMNSIRNLLQSSDLSRDQQRNLQLTLKVLGESY